MTDESLKELIEFSEKGTPTPWPLGYVQGAVRHINKNVDSEAFYAPEGDEDPYFGWDRYNDGPLIVTAVNLAAPMAAELLRLRAALAYETGLRERAVAEMEAARADLARATDVQRVAVEEGARLRGLVDSLSLDEGGYCRGCCQHVGAGEPHGAKCAIAAALTS